MVNFTCGPETTTLRYNFQYLINSITEMNTQLFYCIASPVSRDAKRLRKYLEYVNTNH